MTLTITLHGHACLTIASAETRLLVDPGTFSRLDDAGRPDAILITHDHGDHADPGYLLQSDAPIYAPVDTIATLRGQGIDEARLHEVADGQQLPFPGLPVEAAVGDHAPILPGIPTPLNATYLVDGRLLVPGDAYPVRDDAERIECLLVPASGPWMKISEAIDFALSYPNAVLVPIHDALLSVLGIGSADRLLTLSTGARYQRHRPGLPFTV